MSFLNGNKFADRQAAAAKARKAMAEKFLANSKYDPADPAVIEREAKRKAILEARIVRDAERAKRKAEEAAAEAARRAAEEAARQEQLRLEALAREAEAAAPARRGRAARIRAQARARRALRRAQGAKEEEEIGLRTIRLSRPRFVDPQPRLGHKSLAIRICGGRSEEKMTNPLRLGVAGLGVVGTSLVRLLQRQRRRVRRAGGARIRGGRL